MVTLADGQYSDDPAAAKQSVAGDMLCLLSAVIYGAYTVSIRWVGGREIRCGASNSVLLARRCRLGTHLGAPRSAQIAPFLTPTQMCLYCRKLLREDDETPMTMFFGFMGALIFTLVGPLLLILWCAALGLYCREPLPHCFSASLHMGAVRARPPTTARHSWHSNKPQTLTTSPPFPLCRLAGVGLGSMSWRVFGMMVAKGLLDNVLSDYLWARAILLLGAPLWEWVGWHARVAARLMRRVWHGRDEAAFTGAGHSACACAVSATANLLPAPCLPALLQAPPSPPPAWRCRCRWRCCWMACCAARPGSATRAARC